MNLYDTDSYSATNDRALATVRRLIGVMHLLGDAVGVSSGTRWRSQANIAFFCRMSEILVCLLSCESSVQYKYEGSTNLSHPMRVQDLDNDGSITYAGIETFNPALRGLW
jgi:hypothetical protein